MLGFAAAVNLVYGRQKNFGEAVPIEIVNDERIDHGSLGCRAEGFIQDFAEERLARPRFELEMGGVNAFDGRRGVAGSEVFPIDQQVTFEHSALLAPGAREVSGEIKTALRGCAVGIDFKAVVAEFDVLQLPPIVGEVLNLL